MHYIKFVLSYHNLYLITVILNNKRLREKFKFETIRIHYDN